MASTSSTEGDDIKFTTKQSEQKALEQIYKNGDKEDEYDIVSFLRVFRGDQITNKEGYKQYKIKCDEYHKKGKFQKAESINRVIDLETLFELQQISATNTTQSTTVQCDYEEEEEQDGQEPEETTQSHHGIPERYRTSQFSITNFMKRQLKGSKKKTLKITPKIKDHVLVERYSELDLESWDDDIVHALMDIVSYYGSIIWKMVLPVVDETDVQQSEAILKAGRSYEHNGYHLLRLVRGTLIGGVSDLGQIQEQMLNVPISETEQVSEQLAQMDQYITQVYTCIDETNGDITGKQLVHGNCLHKLRTALYNHRLYTTIIKESFTKYPDAYKNPTKALAELKRSLKLQDQLTAHQKNTASNIQPSGSRNHVPNRPYEV